MNQADSDHLNAFIVKILRDRLDGILIGRENSSIRGDAFIDLSSKVAHDKRLGTL